MNLQSFRVGGGATSGGGGTRAFLIFRGFSGNDGGDNTNECNTNTNANTNVKNI